MNLFLSSVLVGVASAARVLPPGYEDEMWCPPDTCQIYTSPYGYAGALSNFQKCYNPTADDTTDGVWTGSRTNVTAPDGYVEPEPCTGSEYSQCDTDDDCSLEIAGGSCNCYVSSTFHPFDPCQGLDPSHCSSDQCTGYECDEYESKCVPGVDGGGGTCEIDYSPPPTPPPVENKIPAMCDSTDQCSANIRSSKPVGLPFTGVDICGCYAASVLEPFGECEDGEACISARCAFDACDDFEAYCDIAPDDNGMGECKLQPTEAAETLEVAQNKIPAMCDSEDQHQCYANIRSAKPVGLPITGVDMCGCYAASVLEPFDECEGNDEACIRAKCASDVCDGLEAYCDIAMGECRFQPTEAAEAFAIA